MKIKKSHLIVICFFALGTFGLIHVLTLQPDASDRPPGVFEKAGYKVLVPHVDRQPPGYFDTVEHSTKSQISLHRTCNIPYAEVEPLIEKTKTVDERISQTLEAGYEADASVLPMDGSVNLEIVKQVHVRYENSAIWYLTTESLYEIRNRYLQGTCEAAIATDLEKGLPVCQTKKVIVSDIVYEVTYVSATKTEMEAPADSGSIGVSAKGTGSDVIRGEQMFHAVKLDEACFGLNPEQSTI